MTVYTHKRWNPESCETLEEAIDAADKDLGTLPETFIIYGYIVDDKSIIEHVKYFCKGKDWSREEIEVRLRRQYVD